MRTQAAHRRNCPRLVMVCCSVAVAMIAVPNDSDAQVHELCVEATAYIGEREPDQYQGTSLWAGNEYQSGALHELVALARFDLSCLPPGLNVDHADVWLKIKIYMTNDPLNCYMVADRVTGYWDPASVTWNTLPRGYWYHNLGHYVVMTDYQDEQWFAINVTEIVQAWLNGEDNNGIALHLSTDQGSPPDFNKYRFGTASRETARIVINGSSSHPPCPEPLYFAINDGAAVTYTRNVTLNVDFGCSCDPTHYMACEDPSFPPGECFWQYYSGSPGAHPFTLSEGYGTKTVYYKAKNDWCESDVVSDDIEYAPPVQLVSSACYVTPGTANPGDTVTFYFRINNLTSQSIDVGLGASIKPHGTSNWRDDPGHDVYVNCPPGESDHTRLFDIDPGEQVFGSYDAAWGLYETFGGTQWDYLVKDDQLTIIEPLADLTPYQPSNWNDTIPIGITQLPGGADHTYNGPYYSDQTLYFNWACTNIGEATGPNYTVRLEVTGTGGGIWEWDDLSTPPGWVTQLGSDWPVGPLSAEDHTFKLWIDYGNNNPESNEGNNYYERTITVVDPPPDIRIEPLSLDATVCEAAGGDGGDGAGSGQSGGGAGTEHEHHAVTYPDFGPDVFIDDEVRAHFAGDPSQPKLVFLVFSDYREILSRSLATQRSIIPAETESLTSRLGGAFALTHSYRTLPMVAGYLSSDGLEQCRSGRFVSAVFAADRQLHGCLQESRELIDAHDVQSELGLTGSGATVAVLDTGIDYNHPALGGGFGPGFRVIGGYDYVNNNPYPMDDNGHGTTVAGIVGSADNDLLGIAPDVNFVALKVMDADNYGYFADVAAGVDWCRDHRVEFNISIMNMSLGNHDECNVPSECDATPLGIALTAARADGIIAFVASGNDGHSNGINHPACVTAAVSVGAVYDAALGRQPETGSYSQYENFPDCFDDPTYANMITCFTNTDEILDVLAPGRWITTPWLGGGTGDAFGTSQATPHVAGVAALMLEANGGLTPDAIESAILAASQTAHDPRSGLDFPLLNALEAVEEVAESFTIHNDGTGTLEVTSIQIEGGSCWLSVSPPPPYVIAPGESRMVIVRIHADCVPPGAYSDRLLVYNNDPDENPYPDGVYVDLTVNANPTPSITATPGTTVCEGTPVTLDAGAGYSSYFWLPAGQTTQTIDVTTGGVYSVIVTNANGCHGSDEIGITVNPNPTPTITATPGTNVCEGTTVALDAGPGYASYLWSPAGQTTQTIDVITGGTYSVTVMDTNGCDGSDDIVITVNPNPTPTVMATPGTTVCEEETVTLDAGPGYASYLWSPGGQTTQTIEVTAGGTYSVTVTDANGCQGSDDIVITVNPNPTTPTNAAADPPEICAGDSSTLTATVGGAEIDWYTDSCGGTFIETGNSIEVSPTATTTYYARARHVESGCESPNCGQVTVTVNTPGLGDLNCDCAVDAFDIDPFVLALTDPDGYVAAYPDCDVMLADCNGDGVVDAFDIDPFVELLVGP